MSNKHKLHWSRFFWAEWERDNALAICSHNAQSVWMRLLCIASQGRDYGYITINGNIPTDLELAKLMRPHMDVRRFRHALAELERNKVLSRDGKGRLFSRRMLGEMESFLRHHSDGKRGASTRYGEPGYTQKQNQEEEAGSHRQAVGPLQDPTACAVGGPSRTPNPSDAPLLATLTGGEARPRGTTETDDDDLLTDRSMGINPRALGTNPRAVGTNPRAKGNGHDKAGVGGETRGANTADSDQGSDDADSKIAELPIRPPGTSVH